MFLQKMNTKKIETFSRNEFSEIRIFPMRYVRYKRSSMIFIFILYFVFANSNILSFFSKFMAIRNLTSII